jgi:general secretion pathway protein G
MRERGYTLIEVLAVVAIIGLVSSIALPNLLNALNRSRQKRTMADLRGISEAVEMYQVDHSHFPVYSRVGANALRGDLEIYVRRFNGVDGWNNPFYYISDGRHYTLSSLGADGTQDSSMSFGATRKFTTDIVFSDGAFVQWPDGAQEMARPGGG